MTIHQTRLHALAERCEAGAAQLTYEAEHAAEVLAGRGYPNVDAQQWAADKHAAAAAAGQYAEGLRAEAANLSEGQRPSDERLRQAEQVADAAHLGGILIDGSRMSEAAADNPWHSDETRQAIADEQRAETAALAESGMFGHVAEAGQVPYWQLGRTDQTADADDAADTDGW